MPLDRRTFLGALGATALSASLGGNLVRVGAGAQPNSQSAAPGATAELVTNGSFEEGPLGSPIEGWVELV